MKLFASILFIFIFNSPIVLAQSTFDAVFKTKETMYLLRHGKFETIFSRMDPLMKRMMDEDKLMGFWDGLEMAYGEIVSVDEPSINTKDKLILSVTPVQFQKKKLGIKIVFNEKAEISGLFLVSPTPQYQHPDYINPNSFIEFKKTIPDPKYPLEGVLTLPKKGNKLPLIIVLGDLGSIDKDCSLGPNKIYKDLAWGLADNGVAVFRFDTRLYSYKKEVQGNKIPPESYLNDIRQVLNLLKKTPEIDSNQMFILGHGTGAYLLPYIQKNFSNLSGYISFFGNYSEIPDLLIAQTKYLENKLPAGQKAENAALLIKAGKAKNLNQPIKTGDSLPYGLPVSYYKFLKTNSPQILSGELLSKKTLFIQGGRDFQVPDAEMEKWKQAGNNQKNNMWTFAHYPKLNHLGLSGDGLSIPDEYLKPSNLPLEIILKLASFVLY